MEYHEYWHIQYKLLMPTLFILVYWVHCQNNEVNVYYEQTTYTFSFS